MSAVSVLDREVCSATEEVVEVGGSKLRRLRRRVAAAMVLAVAGVGLSAAAAWASSSPWKSVTQTVTGKAQFHGNYRFYSKQDHSGGFELGGTLYDLNKANGRGVKFQARADGTNAVAYYASTDQDRSIPGRVYTTGGQLIVHRGWYQTCQVNNLADDCTAWVSQLNPYW